MNEDYAPTTTTTTKKNLNLKKKESTTNGSLLIIGGGGGKGKYKFWVLAAILLLALCSIFTATITLLKWSSSSATLSRDDFDLSPILDVLEIEEREKVVKHMWELYTDSRRIRLPKFWKKAFEAAYEDLISDVPTIRQAAISEIAKMSIRSIDLDHLDDQSTNARGTNKGSFEGAEGVKKNKISSGRSSQ